MSDLPEPGSITRRDVSQSQFPDVWEYILNADGSVTIQLKAGVVGSTTRFVIDATTVFSAGYNPSEKPKVFNAQPTTPYRVGDIWYQGSASDLMYCTSARASGAYVAGDWSKAVKYTDDTAANAAQGTANTAVTNAATAQTAANNAQASANAANAEIANITSDNVLSKGEKPTAKRDYDVLLAEQAGIDAQATAWSITTEKTTYDNAISALTAYLTGLSPAYTDFTANTTVVGTTFQQKFKDAYDARQALLTKLVEAANAKSKTWFQATAPTIGSRPNAVNGDYWIDTNGDATHGANTEWLAAGGVWVETVVELAKLGTTVIAGGYIKTSLIDVTGFDGDQVAARVNAGSTRIAPGKIEISKSLTLYDDVESNPDRSVPQDAACYLPFDDAPEIPDDPAGTTYRQEAWLTTDGWSAAIGVPVASGGMLSVDGSASYGPFSPVLADFKGKTLRIRCVSATGGALIARYFVGGAWGGTFTAATLVAGQSQLVDLMVPAGSAVTRVQIGYTAGYQLSIIAIYIGTGACLQPAIDASGNGMHCLWSGATPISTAAGSRAHLDGIDDYGEIAANAKNNNKAVVSIFALVKLDAISTGGLIAGKNNSASAGSWGFYRSGATLIFRSERATTFGRWTAPIPNDTNEHAVEVDYDSSSVANDPIFKVDGQVVATTETSAPVGGVKDDSALPICVGAFPDGQRWAGTIGCLVIGFRMFSAAESRGLYLAKSLPKHYTLADWLNDNAASDSTITPQEKQPLLDEWRGIWNEADRTSALPTAIGSITTDGTFKGLAVMANDVGQWTPTTAGTAAKAYYDAVEAWRAYLFATPFVLLSTYWSTSIGITLATWTALRAAVKSSSEALRAKVVAQIKAATTTIEGDAITTGHIKSNVSTSSNYNVPSADRAKPKSDIALDSPYQVYRDEGTPVEGAAVALGVTTCAVSSAAKTFTRSAGSFITDGLVVGGGVRWTGFANGGNNSTFRITALTALVCTCGEAVGLVTEGAAASRSFYPIDTMFRKMEIGPTKGLLATDGQGRTIHDIPSRMTGANGLYAGHLVLNIKGNASRDTITTVTRTRAQGGLDQDVDIDVSTQLLNPNAKAVLLGILIDQEASPPTTAGYQLTVINYYFVAGSTSPNERQWCASLASGSCSALTSPHYTFVTVPVPLVAPGTIRLWERFGFSGTGVSTDYMDVYFMYMGEFV